MVRTRQLLWALVGLAEGGGKLRCTGKVTSRTHLHTCTQPLILLAHNEHAATQGEVALGVVKATTGKPTPWRDFEEG